MAAELLSLDRSIMSHHSETEREIDGAIIPLHKHQLLFLPSF